MLTGLAGATAVVLRSIYGGGAKRLDEPVCSPLPDRIDTHYNIDGAGTHGDFFNSSIESASPTGLLGSLWSYYGRIGAFHVGRRIMHPHTVWFHRDWYRPAEYDTSKFEPRLLLLLHFCWISETSIPHDITTNTLTLTFLPDSVRTRVELLQLLLLSPLLLPLSLLLVLYMCDGASKGRPFHSFVALLVVQIAVIALMYDTAICVCRFGTTHIQWQYSVPRTVMPHLNFVVYCSLLFYGRWPKGAPQCINSVCATSSTVFTSVSKV